MDRQHFYFVYVTCNCLAEFTLRQVAAEILAGLESEAQEPQPQVTLSDEELEARLRADAERMESSPLRDLDYDFFSAPASDAAPVEMPAMPGMGWPPPEWHEADDADELDLEAYLQQAYGHEAALRPRLDHHYSHADLPALTHSLAQLPPHLPALTQRLSVAEMTQWLEAYRAENDAISDLVVRIRQLDMPPPG